MYTALLRPSRFRDVAKEFFSFSVPHACLLAKRRRACAETTTPPFETRALSPTPIVSRICWSPLLACIERRRRDRMSSFSAMQSMPPLRAAPRVHAARDGERLHASCCILQHESAHAISDDTIAHVHTCIHARLRARCRLIPDSGRTAKSGCRH